LERIAARELHGVGPRPPTQHAADHEQESNSVRFGLIHEVGPWRLARMMRSEALALAV
jgi:hypothetical protein